MSHSTSSEAAASMEPDAVAQSSTVAFSSRRGSVQAPMVVSEIADGCLYSGFFGRLDSARMKQIVDRILESVEQYACEVIIVDLASIDIIDSIVAGQLLKVGETLKLVGVSTIFCGISPIVAQTMVGTGVSFDGFTVKRNLKEALKTVLAYDSVVLERGA